MQYLQKEMTKRRDKWLELASRKQSYEITNSTKHRKADEDGVWSWWKVIFLFLLIFNVYLLRLQLKVDELQTKMIAETNRKRRKLERERWALERSQPSACILSIFLVNCYNFIAVRCIPLPPTELPLLPQPSLRKLFKTYPFGVPKPVKRHRYHYPRSHQPRNLVYPEIPTLSVMDINHDLEFLYQNRQIPSTYDMPSRGPPLLWGQASPFPHHSGLGTAGGLPSLGRPVGVPLGPSNGSLPSAPQNQSIVGLPQPNSMMQPHPLAYEEVSPYGGSRLKQCIHRDKADPYLGYSGHST